MKSVTISNMARAELPEWQGRWGVAVSGGGDSVGLLHACLDGGIKPERLMILHYNHGWSDLADQWQRQVVDRAEKLGVEVVCGKGMGKPETNAEEIARNARRDWMFNMCVEHELTGYVTGHTRTDNVELLLMRLARGSGLRGLAGMRARSEIVRGQVSVAVVRPLLEMSRQQVRDYLAEKNEVWVEDPSNAFSFRGRVRAILPTLAEAGVDEEAVSASIAALAQADDALELVELGMFQELAVEQGAGVRMNVLALRMLPWEFQLRLLQRACKMVSGEVMPPRSSKFKLMWQQMATMVSGKTTLGKCVWQWSDARLDVTPE